MRRARSMVRKVKRRERLRVLLTAGPTRSYIDRVRFLSNFSSGRLGFLTAEVLKKKGADVYAVVGPCDPPFEKLKLKKLVRVETNDQMEQAVVRILKQNRITWGVFTAAVLDFRPRRAGRGKTSSTVGIWKIELVPTPKIIDRVAEEFPGLNKIGFKLEWDKMNNKNLMRFGRERIQKNSLDGLVLNFLPDIQTKGKHRAYLFSNRIKEMKVVNSKRQIAHWIANQIVWEHLAHY